MPWTIADVVLAMAAVSSGFLAIVTISGLAAEIIGPDRRALFTPWLAGALGALMLSAVWILGVRKYGTRWRALGLRRPEARGSFLLPWLALLGSLAFTAAYVLIVDAVGLERLEPPPIPGELLGEGPQRLLSTMVVVVWGPFAEEVFFRGFLLAALLPALGPTRAAAVSSAIFAGAHLTLSTMMPIFVTGMLLSWLYLRSRSIWPPFMAHAVQNLAAVAFTP